MCEEASRLLGLYTAALSEFHEVQAPLLRGLNPNSPEFARTMQEKDAAQAVLLQARRRYWDHVRSHECREKPAEPEEKPAPVSGNETDLMWQWITDAKRELDSAHNAVLEAHEELTEGVLPASDGHYAYRQAVHAQDLALGRYLSAIGGLKASVRTSRMLSDKGTSAGSLTRREREVLTHIAAGKSSRQIAGLLGIAFKTVVVHRHNIQIKLKVHNTAALMRTALRMGLIEP